MKVDLSTEQAKRFYKETGFDTTSHGQVSWNDYVRLVEQYKLPENRKRPMPAAKAVV